MTKNARLLCIAGAIVLTVVGAALASNMGFKHVHEFALTDPNIYDISIPLENTYTSLADIYNKISADSTLLGQNCDPASVAFFHEDQSSCTWNGPFSCNDPFPKGQGLRVSFRPNFGNPNGPACKTWPIIGAHDPTFAYTFALSDPNIYDVAPPYHMTALDLAGLYAEIPNASSVTIFNPDQSSCTWNGPFSCNDAGLLAIGVGVRVTVSVAGTVWIPSHY